MSLALILVAVAVAVGVALLVVGVRIPLVARLGTRNALRHRRQTVIVILGLLTGTAIVGASLITADSLEAGLRDAALTALGETDVIIRVPGNLYIPEGLANEVVAAPLPTRIDGTSLAILELAAVEHPSEDLYEPNVVVIGFDAEPDRAFGLWRDRATGERVDGSELAGDRVYLNAQLADKISAGAGDTVVLTYRQPLIPVIPRLHWLNGTLAAATAVPTGSGYEYVHSTQDVFEMPFAVPHGAEGIIAAAAWPDASGTVDLDLELVAPDGTSHLATNGSAGPNVPPPVPVPVPLPPGVPEPGAGPEQPAVLFVAKEDAARGEWLLRVHGKNAQQQPYVSFAAPLVPEYDIGRALAFYEDLEEQFGGDVADALRPDVEGRSAAHVAVVRVERVVAMESKGVFFNGDALFMPRDEVASSYGVPGKVNWIKVTHQGGPVEGLAGTDATVTYFEERIEGLAAAEGDPSGPAANLVVDGLKQEFVTQTEEAAAIFSQFLSLIGTFTLVAGVLLIVNIFSMLAEERRHELGIARAVGLTRLRLILSLTFEGSLYTLVASALGVAVGMALAALLVAGIDSLTPEGDVFSIPYTVTPTSLAVAFAVGSLLTFLTVALASWRASRLNIVRAIRDLEDTDDPRSKPLGPRIVLFGAVVGAVLVGLLLGSHFARVVGPGLALLALGPLASRVVRPDRVWMALAVAAILHTLFAFVVYPAPDTFERDLATVASGLLLVIASAVLLVRWDAPPRLLARLLLRSRRLAALARVATTYPLHRRFRTGLTLTMYALVLLVIVVFSIFFTIFTPDVEQETGGYDVLGQSQVPSADLRSVQGVAALAGTADDPFRDVERVDALVDHFEFGDERIFINGEEPDGFGGGSARFLGFDPAFAEGNGFRLHEWDTSLGSERDVWRRVASDPGYVVVSFSLVGNASEPDGMRFHSGATLTVNTTSGGHDYLIAGVMEQTWHGGVWMQRAQVERLFSDLSGFYLFELAPGTDADEAAKRIERAFRGIGMDADSVDAEAREVQAESTRVFQLFQAYLGLGLIVGVASIGIVTSRAVLERRREIGMLKAIGFTPRMVAGAFLAEVLLVLFAAAVIGVGMGIAVARAIFIGQLSVYPGMHWGIPWGRIGFMLAVALVATLLATLLPARRASRVPPAEALRTIE